jgi:N-methylhydantoinase B
VPAKFSGLRVDAGDTVTYISPSGGGYGDPLDRDPAKVLDDLLDDFITLEHATDVYGVVFDEVDDGYGYAVNAAKTELWRASMRGR